MVAEYALKARLGLKSPYLVGSAGTQAVSQPIPPLIRDRLREKGVDAATHVQRKVTRELLERVDLPVAMGLDHREHIRRVALPVRDRLMHVEYGLLLLK